MTDHAIQAIKDKAGQGVTFQWLRSRFMADHDLKNTLAFGHAVIDTVPKLDQYLYSYGPMIESQWECVADHLATFERPTRLIDYGCGQGLAGLLINDLTGGALIGGLGDILLIEPSAVALTRAAAIYAAIAPGARITCLGKRFDHVERKDVRTDATPHTLHILSNSLDVHGFDPKALLAKTLSPGRHTILSVSHDRDFNGGTPKIERTKAAVEDPSWGPKRTLSRSVLDRFTCNNPSQSLGVVWLAVLEVHHG